MPPIEEQEEVEKKKLPETEEEDPEDKPELPKEPVDKNESIEVKVGEPGARTAKKQNRFREVEESARRDREDAATARREAQEAREQLNRLQQHPQSHQQPQNPHVQRIQQIDEATDRLHQQYQAIATRPGYDPAGPQQKEFERQARELQTARQIAVSQATQPQIDMDQIARRVAWSNFTTKHSDVFTNERAQKWAIGRYMQLVQGEGQPDTEELAERILDEARVKHGMQPRNSRGSKPDAATQRRLSGVSAQATGGGVEVGTVKMGNMERKMAREAYDYLPPEQAYQKWANGPGKAAMQKMAAKK